MSTMPLSVQNSNLHRVAFQDISNSILEDWSGTELICIITGLMFLTVPLSHLHRHLDPSPGF